MIYLDYQATTPPAPEVVEAMQPWLSANFANPHSPSRAGREAAAAISVARDDVTAALGLRGGRLAFTGGATEALNWAIKGTLERRAPEGRTKIVTIATEHAAVLDSVQWAARQGHDVVTLPVGPDGIVDLDAAAAAVDPTTALVAAMLVNNEIGVIQPVSELAALARAAGATFLCDAVQGFGRVAMPEGCDLVALSAHKVHGPKGIGALWMREGEEPAPLLHGGGQEMGLRSGTLSPALCVGFGVAARRMESQSARDGAHVKGLWEEAVSSLGQDWQINGSVEERYRGNLNIRRDGLDVARLLSDCRKIAFSAGSACASGSGRPSHVLRALGLDDRAARSSIRLGFGRYTTGDELRAAIGQIKAAADAQRVLP